MNTNFPLYDNLYQNIQSKDLTVKQKNDFMEKIKNINDIGSELIYALIRVYQMENNNEDNSIILPYDGKFIDNDMIFDLNLLPNKLKQILYKFVKLHTRTMNEENALSETRNDNSISF